MAFSLSSIPKRIHKTFANLRTGIVLLILVVIASALGTFILQRPATDPDKLAQAYSPDDTALARSRHAHQRFPFMVVSYSAGIGEFEHRAGID